METKESNCKEIYGGEKELLERIDAAKCIVALQLNNLQDPERRMPVTEVWEYQKNYPIRAHKEEEVGG